MILANLTDLPPYLAPGSRLLGIDLGDKNIGLALSDTSCAIATPMQTLKRGKFGRDAETFATIIAEQMVGGLIIGLPLNMDGSAGPAAQKARAYARNLAARFDLPIALCDERMSTMAVTHTLLEADTSRRRRAEVVDKMAAAYILQGAIDRMRRCKA